MWRLVANNTIELDPVAMGRPRYYNGRVLTPKSSARYMKTVIPLLQYQLVKQIYDTAIKIEVIYFFRRPARLKKKSLEQVKVLKTTKPDLDNLNKMLLDCMQKAELFPDDKQVTILHSEKYYCGEHDTPKTIYKIYEYYT